MAKRKAAATVASPLLEPEPVVETGFGIRCGWCRAWLQVWPEPRRGKDRDGAPGKDVVSLLIVTCPECKPRAGDYVRAVLQGRTRPLGGPESTARRPKRGGR